MARSLQEQIEAGEPEPFDPEEGDTVIGEVEAITPRTGDWGPYQVITLLLEDGSAVNVACWDTVCRNKVEELEPAIGDMMAFKYLGEKANKGGTATYKNWSVRLARAAVTAAVAAAVDNGDSFPADTDI